MIEEQENVVVLRFFKNDNATMYVDDYDAVITCTFLADDIVYLDRFKGSVNRKVLREFYQWLRNRKINHLLATRSPLHTLMKADFILPGLYHIPVGSQELQRRFGSTQPDPIRNTKE